MTVCLMDGYHISLARNGDLLLKVLNLLDSTFETYGSMACMFLLGLAVKTSHINVKNDLFVDCDKAESSGAALFLVKRILLVSLASQSGSDSDEEA